MALIETPLVRELRELIAADRRVPTSRRARSDREGRRRPQSEGAATPRRARTRRGHHVPGKPQAHDHSLSVSGLGPRLLQHSTGGLMATVTLPFPARRPAASTPPPTPPSRNDGMPGRVRLGTIAGFAAARHDSGRHRNGRDGRRHRLRPVASASVTEHQRRPHPHTPCARRSADIGAGDPAALLAIIVGAPSHCCSSSDQGGCERDRRRTGRGRAPRPRIDDDLSCPERRFEPRRVHDADRAQRKPPGAGPSASRGGRRGGRCGQRAAIRLAAPSMDSMRSAGLARYAGSAHGNDHHAGAVDRLIADARRVDAISPLFIDGLRRGAGRLRVIPTVDVELAVTESPAARR